MKYKFIILLYIRRSVAQTFFSPFTFHVALLDKPSVIFLVGDLFLQFPCGSGKPEFSTCSTIPLVVYR